MAKEYIVSSIRLFLYLLAVFIISFYIFFLYISTDYGSRSIIKYLLNDTIKYEEISIKPSLLGLRVEINDFKYSSAADFSGEEIDLEINFLNSIIGNKIYVSNFSLVDAEVSLIKDAKNNQTSQTEVFIEKLLITNLKIGDTVFKELNLYNFLTQKDSFGFNFQRLNINLPGVLNALRDLDGAAYFNQGSLKIDLDSKQGVLNFDFYDNPKTLYNLEGHIHLEFNDKFKIPHASIVSKNEQSNLRLLLSYDDEIKLKIAAEGDEKFILNFLPSTQHDIKVFLKESEFQADKLNLLLSLTTANDRIGFSSILSSKSSLINMRGTQFKLKNLKSYIDNSSIKLFGENLDISDYSLGNMYLVNNFLNGSEYDLLLVDKKIGLKFDENGTLKSLNGNLNLTEESKLKLNLFDQNLLINYEDIFVEFNFLDSYSFEENTIRIFPKSFKSNLFTLDENFQNSLDFNLDDLSFKNINLQLSMKKLEDNLSSSSNLTFKKFDFEFEDSFIKFENEDFNFGGIVNVSGKDISYSDSTFQLDAIRVLSLIDIRSRLVNIFNADFEKLDQNNFFVNSLDGKFFIDSSGYANIDKLNMNFDIGNAELSGTISSANDLFDNFDMEMIFESTLTENIPWYVAIIGGLPAAASAVVVTEVLEEGLNDISKTTYSISGDVNNLIVDVKQ